MFLSFKSYSLPLKKPFVIQHSSRTHQPTTIVSITKDGITGYGEAPAISYYHVSTELFEKTLTQFKSRWEQYVWNTPDELWHQIHQDIPDIPFLESALNIAAYDWYAKKNELPLYKALHVPNPTDKITNFTIGYDTIQNIKKEIQNTPWPVYKIKLTQPTDIHFIPEILKDTQAFIRIDANTGWTKETIIKNKHILNHKSIEFIEQPLPVQYNHDMLSIKNNLPTSFIADESFQTIQDLGACATYFNGINIKISKCGGITPALLIIKEAKKLNLKIMLGCMTESSIGISAMSHLAGLADYLDADGALLLQEDLALGTTFLHGKLCLHHKNGIGVELTPTCKLT